MSISLQKQVWTLDLAPMEKFVLLKLAYHVSDKEKTGEAYPSIATMARDTGLSERQVQRYLASLVDAKIIVIANNEKGGRGKTRTYRFTLLKGDTHGKENDQERVTPTVIKGDTEGTPNIPQRVTPTTQRVTPTVIKGDTEGSTYIRSEQEENKDEQESLLPESPKNTPIVAPVLREPKQLFPNGPASNRPAPTNQDRTRKTGGFHDIINAWSDAVGIFAPASYGKAIGHAKTLLGAGVTPEDIPKIMRWIRSDPYWADTGIDLRIIVSQVDKWFGAGKPFGDERRPAPADARRGLVAG